jgi:hypothetical protein
MVATVVGFVPPRLAPDATTTTPLTIANAPILTQSSSKGSPFINKDASEEFTVLSGDSDNGESQSVHEDIAPTLVFKCPHTFYGNFNIRTDSSNEAKAEVPNCWTSPSVRR